MISVCIATYNGEKYIKEQLESILSQLKEGDEVIVSDDNSADSTLEIIRRINDKRVRIVYNQSNRGYTSNFENALNTCRGDIIFLSDQDDIWMGNKVQIILGALEKADFVVTNAQVVDANLNTIHDSHFENFDVCKGFLKNWVKTRYIGACMAFNKNVLSKALPFPVNRDLCAHDYWLAMIAELYFKVVLIEIPLIKYRRHDSNVLTGGVHSTNSLTKKIKIRLYVLYNLLKRHKK